MTWTIKQGDWIEVLRGLPDESVHCVVTSPPYWGLRDYGIEGQLGLERTPEEYVAKLVEGFREVRRVLRTDGTCWVNLGDTYAANRGYQVPDGKWCDVGNSKGMKADDMGLKPKDLCGIPWRVAFALQADGWWLRQDIIWAKGQSGEDAREGNVMPESVRDRCTKSHEYIFLLSKSERYFFDAEAIKEPAQDWGTRDRSNWRGGTDDPKLKHSGFTDCTAAMGNRRSVWRINPTPYREAHFATFPPEIPETCIKAGTSEHGCCPECGAPWERVTETDRSFESGSGKAGNTPIGKLAGGTQVREEHDIRMGPTVTTRTTGWQPTCKHNLTPVPCTVLDPFSGAGTTGLVATRLHRNYIGIELNSDYIAMSERRIVGDAPLFNTVNANTGDQ